MKKLLIMIYVISILFSFAACNNKNTEMISDTEEITKGEDNMLSIEIVIGSETFSATLYDNPTTEAFLKQLPLTLEMSELNGNEKYYYLSNSLPTNADRPSNIHIGDLMLYGDSCLVLFYENFSTSYSYTPLGQIDEPNSLADAVGNGNIEITFR